MKLKSALSGLLSFCRHKSVVAAVFLVLALPGSLNADTATSTVQSQIDQANSQISQLQAQITSYQQKLSDLGNQKQTLQNQIDILDVSRKKVSANISVTQAKITQTSLRLTQLGGAITDKQSRIESNQASIAKTLESEYKAEDSTVVEKILAAEDLERAWQDASQLTTLNTAIQSDIADLMQTKASLTGDYNDTKAQQNQLVALRTQLSAQQSELNANRKQEAALLAQTNDSEATYQELLSEAKAELASFSAFVTNAGGAGLLGQETVCDDWGCYYNQRDADWGNVFLSGTRDRLAADGCLVTSMAMVMTHYGYRNVTPVVINSDPGNFSAVGGLLLKTINAGGVTASRTPETVSTKTIDAILATGNPVIVGLHAYGGTHFVVLIKDTGSDYLMRDPYIENGKDISFSAHYSFKNIYEVNKVVISG